MCAAGSLETRTNGKRILFNIKSCLSRSELDRLLTLIQPAMRCKKVSTFV